MMLQYWSVTGLSYVLTQQFKRVKHKTYDHKTNREFQHKVQFSFYVIT